MEQKNNSPPTQDVPSLEDLERLQTNHQPTANIRRGLIGGRKNH